MTVIRILSCTCLHTKHIFILNKQLLHMCAGMGENNCAWNRHITIHRETLAAAAAIYKGIINLLYYYHPF